MAVPYTSSYDYYIPFSDECAQVALATGVAQTYTVPGANNIAYAALFTYIDTANVFVSYNGTAASPGAGTTTTTKRIEFRPYKRYVRGGDTISLITPDASAYVGISLRQLQSTS